MKPSLRDISIATAGYYEINQRDLESRFTERCYAHPRQIAYFLGHELAGKSYPDIGRYFGRDHTSTIHGHRAVQKRIGLMGWPDTLAAVIAIAAEATRLCALRSERERELAQSVRTRSDAIHIAKVVTEVTAKPKRLWDTSDFRALQASLDAKIAADCAKNRVSHNAMIERRKAREAGLLSRGNPPMRHQKLA